MTLWHKWKAQIRAIDNLGKSLVDLACCPFCHGKGQIFTDYDERNGANFDTCHSCNGKGKTVYQDDGSIKPNECHPVKLTEKQSQHIGRLYDAYTLGKFTTHR